MHCSGAPLPCLELTGSVLKEVSMNQLTLFTRRFWREDSGVVTIDWVVLTSAVIALGLLVVYPIYNTGVSGLTQNVSDILVSVSQDDSNVTVAINGGG